LIPYSFVLTTVFMLDRVKGCEHYKNETHHLQTVMMQLMGLD
jgi:hypothetical protein